MKPKKRKRIPAVAASAVEPVLAVVAVEQLEPAAAVAHEADVPVCAELVSAEPAAIEMQDPMPESSVAPMDCPQDPIVALPSNSTVKDAGALKAELMKVLEMPATVALDVRGVERVDTATIQLLYAFVRDRAAMNLSVQWLGCPTALSESARLLGVQSMLALPVPGDA